MHDERPRARKPWRCPCPGGGAPAGNWSKHGDAHRGAEPAVWAEKDDIISKLTYKIKQLEKQNNTSEDIKNTSSNTVPLDKFNKLLIQLNELEEKFKILQKENLTLKKNKKSKKKKEKKKDNNNSNDMNMKDYINQSIK